MAGIGGRDTTPELLVRRYLHATGLRYRLHDRNLPGRPDIVLPKYKVAIYVHGCFWHRHPGCRYATIPATRPDFWVEKFAANVARDRRNVEAISRLGWTPMIVWECTLRDALSLDDLYWRIVETSAS